MFPSLGLLESAAAIARADVRRLLLAAAQDDDVTVLGVELAALDAQLENLASSIRKIRKCNTHTKGRVA